MKRLRFNTGVRLFLGLLVFSGLALIPSACVPGDQSELIESLLDNTSSLGGELHLVTKDGETYTVTISKGTPETSPANTDDGDGCNNCNNNDDCGPKLEDYLPCLNSEKDIFRTLGLWEQASALKEAGKTWAETAAELGFTQDTLLAAVKSVIDSNLHEAKVKGLLTYEKYEYKVGYYGDLAEKWVGKIFATTAATPTAKLEDYLPSLNSEKDVFKTLGMLEQAKALKESGLTWSEAAAELGYTPDTLLAAVKAVIESNLGEALQLGLINQEKYDYKVGYYGDLAEKWTGKIFADVPLSLEDYLPVMNCEADIFAMLGITDDVYALHDNGAAWADIAASYGYTADTMYSALKQVIESGLHEAKVKGLITYDEYSAKLSYYYDLAFQVVGNIFSDTGN